MKKSIPAAAWFVLVSELRPGFFTSCRSSLFSTAITTVGYGEITPRSFLGQIITIPLLVFGLLLIALPTFVLGREFSAVWDIMSRAQVLSQQIGFVVAPNPFLAVRKS